MEYRDVDGARGYWEQNIPHNLDQTVQKPGSTHFNGPHRPSEKLGRAGPRLPRAWAQPPLLHRGSCTQSAPEPLLNSPKKRYAEKYISFQILFSNLSHTLPVDSQFYLPNCNVVIQPKYHGISQRLGPPGPACQIWPPQ